MTGSDDEGPDDEGPDDQGPDDEGPGAVSGAGEDELEVEEVEDLDELDDAKKTTAWPLRRVGRSRRRVALKRRRR